MIDAAMLLASARTDLTRLPRILDALLGDLDTGTWRERPAPTEWSPVEIVCHLRDEEVEDFGARVRVVVEDGTQFTPIDPERWAVERGYRDAVGPQALAAFAERRAASLTFLASVDSARLTRGVEWKRGAQFGFPQLSGLDLLAAWVTHDRLHLAQLAATLARLGAHHWAPLRAEYAGPIPYGEPVQ